MNIPFRVMNGLNENIGGGGLAKRLLRWISSSNWFDSLY